MVLLDGTMIVTVSQSFLVAITEENEIIVHGDPEEGLEETFAKACFAAYMFQGSVKGTNAKLQEES